MRCEVCGRGAPDERLIPGEPCLCSDCDDNRGMALADGIMSRAEDLGFLVLYSNVNQGYIIIRDLGSNSELKGVKNDIIEVREFLDDWEENYAAQAS